MPSAGQRRYDRCLAGGSVAAFRGADRSSPPDRRSCGRTADRRVCRLRSRHQWWPPSILLSAWTEFDRCRAEPETGFREVYFEYDNELELWATGMNSSRAFAGRSHNRASDSRRRGGDYDRFHQCSVQ